MGTESVVLSPMHCRDSDSSQVSVLWLWLQSVLADSLAKSDAVFDWVSAIVASMFGAGEVIDEILEEE